MSVKTIVDLDRYPIDGSDPSKLEALVDGCRRDLAARGASVMEGFVRPEAIQRIVDAVDPLSPLAFHKVKHHNVYLEADDPDLPTDHPRNATVTSTSATLGNHHLQQAADLQALYADDHFKAFVAAALGYPKLFPYDDAVSGVNVLFYAPGTALGWHFDNAAFTTTLMIREADAGAAFEFVPFLRSDTYRAYDEVGALLKGDRRGVQELHQTDGTLVLFKGSRTVHQVTPVEGSTTRLLATMTFSPEPGARLSPINQKTFYDYVDEGLAQ
jgi:predicted 2-oxoglutarate/Fe(II)-dependent dioxygenase YbiX